jgi:hypothetical protein
MKSTTDVHIPLSMPPPRPPTYLLPPSYPFYVASISLPHAASLHTSHLSLSLSLFPPGPSPSTNPAPHSTPTHFRLLSPHKRKAPAPHVGLAFAPHDPHSYFSPPAWYLFYKTFVSDLLYAILLHRTTALCTRLSALALDTTGACIGEAFVRIAIRYRHTSSAGLLLGLLLCHIG